MWTDRLGRWSIRSGQTLLVLTLASVAVFALVQLKLVVIPVLIAIILACAAAPLIGWLRRRGFGRTLAAFTTLIGGILVFGGIITGVVFAVRGQWDELSESAVAGFEQLQDWVLGLDLPFDLDQIDWDDVWANVQSFLTSSSFTGGAVTGLTVAGEIITGIVLAVVVLFFFLRDGDTIWAFILKPFNRVRQARGERIGQAGVRVLGGYLRGTAFIALVDAVGIGVGVALVGVPLALPLAVIVFVSAFIPIVGATAAGVVAAAVALVANGPVQALIVVGIVILVNQLEGNFLQPVVMGQSLKIHPLVILLALTVGTILGGIVGAVLSVPIAALAWSIVKDWDKPTDVIAVPRRRRWWERRATPNAVG